MPEVKAKKDRIIALVKIFDKKSYWTAFSRESRGGWHYIRCRCLQKIRI